MWQYAIYIIIALKTVLKQAAFKL